MFSAVIITQVCSLQVQTETAKIKGSDASGALVLQTYSLLCGGKFDLDAFLAITEI